MARYVPFSAVAGDFYDVIAEDGTGVAVIVADGATCSVESVAENGLLLGLMPEAPYTQTEGVVLHPGDRLLLYTDGLIEASGPGGECFEQSRLEATLAEGAAPGRPSVLRPAVRTAPGMARSRPIR